MKNKKTLVSAIAISVTSIFSIDANAAMSLERQKELCAKSKTKVWDDYIQVCVPENACKKDKYAAHCDYVFDQIDMFSYGIDGQKNNIDDVIDAMNFYVSNKLGWEFTCDPESIRYPAAREYDDNFVGCKFGPHYLTFKLGSIMGVSNKKLAGYCYTFGAQDISYSISPSTGTNKLLCDGISLEDCETLGGEYVTYSNGHDVKWCLIDE